MDPEQNKQVANRDLPELISLLQKNNQYLEELLKIQKKQHRMFLISQIIQTILTLIPWITVLIVGFLLWQTIMQNLQALNNNVNTLKGNFDSFYQFFADLKPELNSVSPKLEETWEKLKFWE